MLTAKMVLDYPSATFAKSVMTALRPDNRLSKGQMRITADVRGNKLYITVTRCSTLETMQSTLEDMFRCVKAAQESISLTEGTKDKRFK